MTDDGAPAIGDLIALAHDHLDDRESGWNIGTFGAIAEFNHRDDDPATVTTTADGGSLVGVRGGVRIVLSTAVQAVAYESLGGRADSWNHGLTFCLPAAAAAMGDRAQVTPLGADDDALRDGDHQGRLFDLGLAIPHVDFCVRTDDPSLIDALDEACGQNIFAAGATAMAAIKAASPHRVAVSRLGRVEVYQEIGSSRLGVPTPEGPHTHVLPDLLGHRRTHSAHTPIPDGWLPYLNLHPANPLSDRLGRRRAFDGDAYGRFQGLIGRYAPAGFADEKERIAAAVRGEGDAAGYAPATTRLGRLAAAVQLRQLVHTDGGSEILDQFQQAFGRRGDPAPETLDGH